MTVNVTPVAIGDDTFAAVSFVQTGDEGPVVLWEGTLSQDDYDIILVTMQNRRQDVWDD